MVYLLFGLSSDRGNEEENCKSWNNRLVLLTVLLLVSTCVFSTSSAKMIDDDDDDEWSPCYLIHPAD